MAPNVPSLGPTALPAQHPVPSYIPHYAQQPTVQYHHGNGRAAGSAGEHWVTQFNSMTLSQGTVNPVAPTFNRAAEVPVGPGVSPGQGRMMQPAYVPVAPGPFGSTAPAYQTRVGSMGPSIEPLGFTGPHHLIRDGQSLSAVDVAIVKKIYEADFDKHMTQWMRNEGADTDFAEQMDQWMKDHGTNNQTVRGAATRTNTSTTSPPLSSNTAAIIAALSKDYEYDGQEDEAHSLARVANDIIHSVAGNTSDKFANSEFLNLMHAISDGRVVVQGNTLTDKASPNKTQAVNAQEHRPSNSSAGSGSKKGNDHLGSTQAHTQK